MKKNNHRLTIRIDEEMIFKLKLITLNKGESLNSYISNAVLDKMEKDIPNIKMYVN